MNAPSYNSSVTSETLAAFFTEMRDDVMSRWAAQVISEIPLAAGLDSPVLIDTLPILYDDIAEAVSPGVERPFATAKSNLARMHGQERARMTNYGPGDVVQELQIFRDVIFFALKARGVNLGVKECEIIGKSIDIATRDAISDYCLVLAKMNETFIASLSHDLRNPLHVANCIAQLMQIKWSDLDLISMAKRVCSKLRDVDGCPSALLLSFLTTMSTSQPSRFRQSIIFVWLIPRNLPRSRSESFGCVMQSTSAARCSVNFRLAMI